MVKTPNNDPANYTYTVIVFASRVKAIFAHLFIEPGEIKRCARHSLGEGWASLLKNYLTVPKKLISQLYFGTIISTGSFCSASLTIASNVSPVSCTNSALLL